MKLLSGRDAASSARGSRAGRPVILGAVALSAAAVALAGCATVSPSVTGSASSPLTSATGSASSPSTSAPSGTGVTSVPAGPQPGPQPGPRRRAIADADAIFASFVVPPGARRLSRAPSAGGGELKVVGQHPATSDLVDKAGWWLAPGGPRRVLAWEKAHVPHRFAAEGSGSEYGPPGSRTIWNDDFSLPAVYGVLDSRDLLVQTLADGKKMTAIRLDAQVTWTPARPVTERIPAAAKAVTISEDPGTFSGSKKKPPSPVTITDPAKVRRLVALIDGLPLFPPGEYSCPADWGANLTLTFRAGSLAPALAVATADLTGCPAVDLTIGGKRQPQLDAVTAAQILQIAGLTWKVTAR